MSSGYTVFGRSTLPFPAFKAAFPWIGGDLQTIKNTISWSPPRFALERQSRLTFPMNDGTGDELQGLLDEPQETTNLPLLVLVHGLTGCEESRNIMTSAWHYLSEGFPVLRLNLRGAGPSLPHCTQQYHAGRSEDLASVVQGLADRLTNSGVVLVGASLGGNTILKFIDEGSASNKVIAAASVCAPIDLKQAQLQIMAPRNAIYHRYLIRRMKADALNGAQGSQRDDITKTLDSVHTVYDFDDRIIAPHNGFRDAEDYYGQCSAKNLIDQIGIPTLVIHAASDPWIPLSIYMERSWPADAPVSLAVSRDGGHVGFHSRDLSTPWHNACISRFFKKVVGGSD